MNTSAPQGITCTGIGSHRTTIKKITVYDVPDGPAVCALKELSITSARAFQGEYDIGIIVAHSHCAEIAAAQKTWQERPILPAIRGFTDTHIQLFDVYGRRQ
jgi:hypothetical protein